MTAQSPVYPNAPCSNCSYVFGAHGVISGICPNGRTFYAPVWNATVGETTCDGAMLWVNKGKPSCGAKCCGWACTLPRNHSGRHIDQNDILASWTQGEEIATHD